MKIVVKRPGAKAEVVEVDGRRLAHKIDSLLDGGYRGRAFSYSADVMAWCDDDGIRKDLPINFSRPRDNAPIHGTVVVTAMAGEGPNRDLTGLSDAQVVEVLELLAAIGVES